jgi:hypothetical protein
VASPASRIDLCALLGVQVEKGERRVDLALVAVDEAEVVLARGVRRREKERLVLPLYQPMASSLEEADFSAPVLTVVSAMVCCLSQASRVWSFARTFILLCV